MIHESKKRKLLGETDKIQVLAVFEANEKLHNSFYKYDAKKVEVEAKNVAKAIEAIKNTEVKRLSFSKGKLEEISASVDRKKNNENYHLFSMAVIHILKSYDLEKSIMDMAVRWLRRNGFKIQKGIKVYNPYDPSMPHCGGMETHYH